MAKSSIEGLQRGWYRGADGVCRSGIELPPAGFEYDRHGKMHKAPIRIDVGPDDYIYNMRGDLVPAPPFEFYFDLTKARKCSDVIDITPRIQTIIIPDLPSCIACNERRSSELIYPCGHTVLCGVCSKKLVKKECPICRKPIKEFIKVYA